MLLVLCQLHAAGSWTDEGLTAYWIWPPTPSVEAWVGRSVTPAHVTVCALALVQSTGLTLTVTGLLGGVVSGRTALALPKVEPVCP